MDLNLYIRAKYSSTKNNFKVSEKYYPALCKIDLEKLRMKLMLENLIEVVSGKKQLNMELLITQ